MARIWVGSRVCGVHCAPAVLGRHHRAIAAAMTAEPPAPMATNVHPYRLIPLAGSVRRESNRHTPPSWRGATARAPVRAHSRRGILSFLRCPGVPALLPSRRAAGLRRHSSRRWPASRRGCHAGRGAGPSPIIPLERGRTIPASDSAGRSLAFPDSMTPSEHRFDLARIDNAAHVKERAPTSRQRIEPAIQQVLDAITKPQPKSATSAATSLPSTHSATPSLADSRRDCAASQRSPLHVPQSERPRLLGPWDHATPISSPFCAPPSAVIPTTKRCRTLSANCHSE